jgi:hypothetical protein
MQSRPDAPARLGLLLNRPQSYCPPVARRGVIPRPSVSRRVGGPDSETGRNTGIPREMATLVDAGFESLLPLDVFGGSPESHSTSLLNLFLGYRED